jgi:hypothetical protein
VSLSSLQMDDDPLMTAVNLLEETEYLSRRLSS